MYHRNLIFSIKPQIFELKCVFSYFRLKTHITLLLPVYVHSWEQRKLGDFGKATGGTSIESEFSEDGIYKVISIGSYSENSVYNDQGIRAIKSDKTSNRVLNRNDLTMILNDKTTSGNIIGRVLLIEESGIYVYNQRTERIEINLDEYDSVFLYEMLNAPNIREKIIKQAQGNTQIYVNWTAISLLKYMIPSKEEQVKIGEYLHSISNLITLHQCKCQIDGCRFQSPLAITWEQRKLGDIGKARSGVGFPDADQGGVTGVPFFKVSDMNLDGNENEMIVANNYVTAEQIADHRWSPITELPAIFFAKVGAAVMLNRKRLCRFPFLLDNNTMAYSLSPTKWDADFAKALFGTVDLTSLVQVGALPSYNAGDVESMGIYLPSLFEQEQIGAFFKLLDNLITLHQCE